MLLPIMMIFLVLSCCDAGPQQLRGTSRTFGHYVKPNTNSVTSAKRHDAVAEMHEIIASSLLRAQNIVRTIEEQKVETDYIGKTEKAKILALIKH